MRLKQQQAELAGLIRQQYKHGKQSYTQLILQNKNPHDVPRQLKYFSYIAKARAQLIDDMQGNLTQVARLNDKTTATLQQVVALKNKQELEKKQLQAQSREKSKVVKGLSSQIAAQRNEIDKLKRDEKNLFNLVERLAKIVPPKKHISKKANNKKQKTNTNTNTNTSNEDEANKENASVVATNDTLPNTDVTGIHFANLRGKLRLPVRGEVSNRFGSNRADTGVSWKGLFIRAAEGNEVKTVADGRVVFADWMRGFGNLIIIDHGSGYMSLYGNNQAILKRVGDDVDAGDAIASVGNTGGNESNGLYYELRHNSQPFDPMQWSER